MDLQIAEAKIDARVSGSALCSVKDIVPVPKARSKAICKDCAGGIDSLVELLQGRFSKGVMERIHRQRSGLFPAPEKIRFSCSCPDWASMCKHVAAVLYGVDARLDDKPELLFPLCKVDEKDLQAGAPGRCSTPRTSPPRPGSRRRPCARESRCQRNARQTENRLSAQAPPVIKACPD
ncbi:MAG: SWIM zinc finger family protein [Acidobacteriota bacterium]